MGACALLDGLIEEADADHDVMTRLYSQVMKGFTLAFLGDTGAAALLADAALAGHAELIGAFKCVCHSTMAAAHLVTGDAAAAVEEYQVALQIQGPPVMAGTFAFAALAPLASGDLVTARQWADEAVAVTQGCYLSGSLTTRARVKIAFGDLEQAERDLHEALTIAAATGTQSGLPNTLECLAQLAVDAESHREAARLFGAADALRQRTGEVRFEGQSADYAHMVDALSNTMGANDFEAAWAEGAALSTDEAIAYAQRGRGERKRPSSGWAALTPAELEVARLVSDGLANKDIATRLLISPRTVETHLTHAYSKLGLTSRVQLAQEAARHA